MWRWIAHTPVIQISAYILYSLFVPYQCITLTWCVRGQASHWLSPTSVLRQCNDVSSAMGFITITAPRRSGPWMFDQQVAFTSWACHINTLHGGGHCRDGDDTSSNIKSILVMANTRPTFECVPEEKDNQVSLRLCTCRCREGNEEAPLRGHQCCDIYTTMPSSVDSLASTTHAFRTRSRTRQCLLYIIGYRKQRKRAVIYV